MKNTQWTIDPTHAEVGFKVKHMMFTTITGRFNEITATVKNEGDAFEQAVISFSAKVASIDTNNVDRDTHLKSADFFEVEKYENITFTSTSIQRKSDHDFLLTGMLEIKGQAKEVTFNAEYSGILTDPWGNAKIALALEGKINRKDFGLTWNAALETGGVLVGEEIKLFAEVQFAKL